MSLLSGVGALEARQAHRSGCEQGSLELLLQLPTGCEGHWCDSTNYRGRKQALQTFRAAAQPASAELKPSSTSHLTLLIAPGRIVFQVSRWNEILFMHSQVKRNTLLSVSGGWGKKAWLVMWIKNSHINTKLWIENNLPNLLWISKVNTIVFHSSNLNPLSHLFLASQLS